MINHSKKLPCGHIFHTTCLRSWFQRQQTCPTCRLNILRTPNANSTAIPRADEVVGGGAAGQGAAAAATPTAAAAPIPNQANGAEMPRVDGAAPPNAAGIPGLFENIGMANVGTSNLPGGLPSISTTAAPSNFPTLPLPPPFMIPPPFPFIAPYAVPPPPMPSDLSTLSDEELKLLEGNERRNVEERIKVCSCIKSYTQL